MTRYQVPRSADPSAEKNKEEGQNYSTRPTALPKIRQGVIRGRTVEKETDGYTHEYHEYNAPLSKDTFNKLTNKKYTNPRGT